MITDKDNTQEFLDSLKKVAEKEIHVGILGKADAKIQLIAAANEFGAVIKSDKARKWLFAHMADAGIKVQKKGNSDGFIHIPERAAIRKAFDNGDNVGDAFRMGQMAFDKTGDIETAVNAIGSAMVGKIQESYIDGQWEKNHPLTTAMKDGKDKPLINSGKLQQAVSYEIT